MQPSASSGAAAGKKQACGTATTTAALATARIATASVNMTDCKVPARGTPMGVPSVTAGHPAAIRGAAPPFFPRLRDAAPQEREQGDPERVWHGL